MKGIVGGAVLIFVGVSGWFVGSQLSADAIGMAVGILFGIMAGVPVAIMVLASRRQADQFYGQQGYGHGHNRSGMAHGRGRNAQLPYGQLPHGQQGPYAPQPPVIVVTGNGAPQQAAYSMQGYPQMNALPPAGERYVDLGPASDQPPMQQPPMSQPNGRQFRVVGEQEEWIDGW